MIKTDFLIIGAGIIGMTIARELKTRFQDCTILIIEKESFVARHASGRNSGVLHAGFYYHADSMKAQFTALGNDLMHKFVDEKNLAIRRCGKLVVARNEHELTTLDELYNRAKVNSVPLEWVSEAEAKEIDPNAKTFSKALWSPTTSTVDPTSICYALKEELESKNISFLFNEAYQQQSKNKVKTDKGMDIAAGFIINSAGLYADKIARDFGFSQDYVLLPFKGLYAEYNTTKTSSQVRTNIYPVPVLKNPFLGVHFTMTVSGTVKIGPTAIPGLWRENYGGLKGFSFQELLETFGYNSKLFLDNSFGFRKLALNELRKQSLSSLGKTASQLVHTFDTNGLKKKISPGIRAQLLNKKKLELVQDFVVEGNERSIHILNAVSPAFTCSIPIAKHVVQLISKSLELNQQVEMGSK